MTPSASLVMLSAVFAPAEMSVSRLDGMCLWDYLRSLILVGDHVYAVWSRLMVGQISQCALNPAASASPFAQTLACIMGNTYHLRRHTLHVHLLIVHA